MAEICCEVSEGSREGSSNSRAARRRRMDLRRVSLTDDGLGVVKRPRMEDYESESRVILRPENGGDMHPATVLLRSTSNLSPLTLKTSSPAGDGDTPTPKFGIASVCGRRRDMEDAVTIQPSFCRTEHETAIGGLHYFGVYDGHGCSHVATKCRERLHEVVKEELVMNEHEEEDDGIWKSVMERSFNRMDKEVVAWNENVMDNMTINCRCELQSPECDAVGSTAVVAVVSPDKIVVANCGDSRAVLCRNGRALPLSTDHKPDRPDELNRIQAAGGRVIYWEGARVLGVLAMSRAIGDNYLKPYVSCEPEVSITERSEEDECLILASDGLWDVVSNETACGVARMCLRAAPTLDSDSDSADRSDKACNDASMLLTKLALARRSADNVSVVVIDLRKPTSAFL